MEVQIEIAPADNTTKREAQEIALLIRQAIEQLDTVSCIEPIQIQRPDRTKGGAIESLQEFFVSFAPAGLRAMLGVVKAIAGRPRQPKTTITIKGRKTQFKFEFDPNAVSLQDIVDNVSRLPGLE
jgi:hypothetical protein